MSAEEDNQKDLREWTKVVYERAQEDAFHSDSVAYEVAAIVWSANILLLGFVLEVPLTPRRQSLVLVAAVVSAVFTAYVPYVLYLTKIGQGVAQGLCRQIEVRENLPDWLQLHNKIDLVYKKKRGQMAVYLVTIVFLALWVFVGLRAFAVVFRD
ncbi:MAG: hypothetical protein WA517_18200 [Candidatus Acidiferrum sp.]